jgi:hypothetical protein
LIILPILHRVLNVTVLAPLGPGTEEEQDSLLHLNVVDAVSGADINLQFPHTIATEAVAAQVSGINDTVDPTLYRDPPGNVTNPIKPVLIDIASVGIEAVQDLHSIFAYKRIRVKRGKITDIDVIITSTLVLERPPGDVGDTLPTDRPATPSSGAAYRD